MPKKATAERLDVAYFMKKFMVLLTVVALLICAAPTAFASGGAYWSGPDTVRAGDTITLTFYAGGENIIGINGSVSYDSSVLTLQGCSPCLGGSWSSSFERNFLVTDESQASPINGYTAIFRATFTVNAGVAVGTTVSVSASGSLGDTSFNEFGFGCSYSKTIAKPLSDNCNLKSLSVSGATISPAFSPSVTSYSAKVPFATASIGVNATAEDEGAKVSVNNPALTPGGTTYVTITVTAENGATKKYTIAVAREQDPNYVESNNNDLSSLSVEGYALSPQFDPAVTQYYVWLPYEVDSISVSAAVADSKANYTVGTCTGLIAGQGTDIAVTVTAENGEQKVYTITAVRAPELEKTEEYISGVRETIPTEPEETQPATEETTQPTQEAPQPAVQTGHPTWLLVLMALIGAAVGVGDVAAIVLLQKKRR